MPAIKDMAECADPAPADLVAIVDDPAGTPVTKKAYVAALLGLAWPVGSVFTSIVDTNPATLLGFGTWSAIGAGRCLVGKDTGDADFDTLEEAGGAKTVTLTEAQMPAHTHVQGVNSAATGGLSGYTADTTTNTRVNSGYSTSSATTGLTVNNATPTNQNTGGGQAHPNLPPYLVVRFWKRTA